MSSNLSVAVSRATDTLQPRKDQQTFTNEETDPLCATLVNPATSGCFRMGAEPVLPEPNTQPQMQLPRNHGGMALAGKQELSPWARHLSSQPSMGCQLLPAARGYSPCYKAAPTPPPVEQCSPPAAPTSPPVEQCCSDSVKPTSPHP